MNPFLLNFAESYAQETADVAKAAMLLVVRLRATGAHRDAVESAQRDSVKTLYIATAARAALDQLKIRREKYG